MAESRQPTEEEVREIRDYAARTRWDEVAAVCDSWLAQRDVVAQLERERDEQKRFADSAFKEAERYRQLALLEQGSGSGALGQAEVPPDPETITVEEVRQLLAAGRSAANKDFLFSIAPERFVALCDLCLAQRDEIAEWKREAELSKWPKEAAQEYFQLKAEVAAQRDVVAAAEEFYWAHKNQRNFKGDYEWPADEFAALGAALESVAAVVSGTPEAKS